MRTSRTFPAVELHGLEDRVLLSPLAAGSVKPIAADVHAGAHLVPGAPVPGPSSGKAFAVDIDNTLDAGLPVYEQRVTHYGDGTTQVEDQLTVPSGNSTTTTDWIELRGAGGIQKSVNVATKDGSTTTYNSTTTPPSGAVSTETETYVNLGNETLVSATVDLAGGGTETVSGDDVFHGHTEIADRSTTEADGVHQSHSVTVSHGQYHQTSTTTTSAPGGTTFTLRATTTVTRLALPAS